METVTDFIFLGSNITADGDCSHKIKRCLFLGRKVMTKFGSILKRRDITLLTKFCLVKAIVFSVVMCGCESWTIKKAEYQRTLVLEKTLESPVDCKEIKPVNPTGNQSWIFIRRTDAGAPMLGPHDAKSKLIRKIDSGKDLRQVKGMTEDKMIGWHHQFNGHEFKQAPGESRRTGKLSMLQSMGSQRVRHDCVTEQQ